ncbi:MAG: hypothetical protein IPJ31_00710 [Bacteroidetes bacterium]|nr:hypothetical protein [Bacteroidota bacterium]
MKKIVTFILLSLAFSQAHSQIMMNEYSCSNTAGVVDAYNQRHDWLELYNAGAVAVDITGYFISDDPNNLTKWLVPTTTLLMQGGEKWYFLVGGIWHILADSCIQVSN